MTRLLALNYSRQPYHTLGTSGNPGIDKTLGIELFKGAQHTFRAGKYIYFDKTLGVELFQAA
ncbi:hypothetical protein, partial [uncultured Microscilla sp.]|uniref:hypothetical protein n=1 Tax=uncultured Microscilla sp. TaxID=432653 RepID=UPI002607C708